jgi:DNA-binding SARP family transcriptional activator/tetratricopeptide (TPR) repeat protein
MLREKRLRLQTLGQLALIDHTGSSDESLARRPRKLALLAVLALAPRPVTRDALVGMFWGEQDESRARHSLSDALSHLRSALGRDAIITNGANVSLAADAPLDVDVHELARAANAADHPRVTYLYRGPFLESVYVGGSESFDLWVGRERQRLEQLFLRSAASHCEILVRTGRSDECAALAARWLDAAPTSADAALYLLNALSAPGTREAALRALAEYERLVRRLADDYVLSAERPVVELAERLREQAHQTLETPVATLKLKAEIGARPSRIEPATARDPRRLWVAAAAIALALVPIAFGVAALRADRVGSALPTATRKPVAAFVSFDVTPNDTALAWLSDGLPQMIATALARASSLELVPPKRVRDLQARAGGGASEIIERSASKLTSLGRKVGATLVVDGQLGRRDSLLVLELRVYDAATAAPVRLHTLSNANPLALADEAAARVLAAVDARAPGPRLTDLETSSVEAYQLYVRAVALLDIGRVVEARRAVDAAIARDSGFVSALYFRDRLEIDPETRSRLRAALKRYESRATEWDRLELQTRDAHFAGERGRAESLARLLVSRFPRDPRAYRLLAGLLESYGRWPEADSVMQAVLSLDSLGMEAGRGPCAPCVGYVMLATGRIGHGDFEGATRAALRLTELQPGLPTAWVTRAWVSAQRGQFDEAIAAVRRASTLAQSSAAFNPMLARVYILSRRFTDAERLIAEIRVRRADEPETVDAALDLRALLERERGQLRRAISTTDTFIARNPGPEFAAVLVKAHATGRLGETTEAIRLFERHDHGPARTPVSLSADPTSAGQRARGFAWHHALEADAIATVADTMYLRALADSVERIGAQSYFGRDWRLHHHIRGLIAARGGRHAEAAREFSAARWDVGGWTRTNVEMARSLLALGRAGEALAVLRQAYATQLDGMGRYSPRTEIDYWMSRAFTATGARDSATVYSNYVRRAWEDADPEVRRQYRMPD